MDSFSVNEQHRRRFAFLRRLYEITGGDRYQFVNQFELGQEIGLSHQDASLVADYLEGEGLIKNETLGGGISITHHGVVEVERAVQQPDEPSQFFPPVNVIYAGAITNSMIQQGSSGSSQTGHISANDLQALRQFNERMRRELPNLQASQDVEGELTSDLSTLEAQVASPRPKPSIIRESLRSMRTILEGMAGNALAAALLEAVRGLQF